ncbi:hypothetical protein Purlil1_815 [Purpureocillium lilacinum]|uniref:Transmembrane protein n=1 Tax=Purpureocillium lilacinum TaxID=33203 RepID=A0ABR0CFQ3_PURLI|nr:hypothetical protein Purlil1_815 [Purpureocillium lilacinum]
MDVPALAGARVSSPLPHDALYRRSQDVPADGSDDVPAVDPDDAPRSREFQPTDVAATELTESTYRRRTRPVRDGKTSARGSSSSPKLAKLFYDDRGLTIAKGHTVSQRLRKLKQIPAELIPLAVVVGFAVFAAGYSSVRKFFVDKNLRLSRQGPSGRAEH